MQRAHGSSFGNAIRQFSSRTLAPGLLAPLRDDVTVVQLQPRNIHDVAAAAVEVSNTPDQNFTVDLCRTNDHCSTPRNCIRVGEESFGGCEISAKPEDLCFCWPGPVPLCETSKDCVPEEVCVIPKDVKDQLCVSRTYLNYPAFFRVVDAPPSDEEEKPVPKDEPKGSTEPVAEDSCIDARALGHLAEEDLVLGKHATAHVLCDVNESCATPGHVVVFNGKPMMMRTYCASVGCERKVMTVNSPRFQRALRVRSRTDRLEYTAFAARYETTAEEALMKVAVRAGL